MSINPANLPTDFILKITQPRFRTKVCVECMYDGKEVEVEYFYGHLHNVRDGTIVVTGHCVDHIKVIAPNVFTDVITNCDLKKKGCSGLWRAEFGLERVFY